ncbi:biliverdin-producing heme oxygenase [Niabella insulamsoli]|uniref:biliverdin-producing heme oxygenase n=1 Tax=Niabella insulamsoli TaxID=3144874 RepID=UPI0031FC4D9D
MLSDILKKETAPLHEALEKTLFSKDIFSGAFDLEKYRLVLHINFVVHEVLEPQLFAALGPHAAPLSLAARSKSEALQKDMQQAGLDVNIDQNMVPPAPRFDTPAQALGGLYVLEGATLGGRVIVKHLKQQDIFSTTPFFYYNVYAAETGTYWTSFLDVLNQANEAPDEVVTGARKIYHYYLEVAAAFIAATKN